MSSKSIQEIYSRVKQLIPEEQIKLAAMILNNLPQSKKEETDRNHSIMELQGLGKEIWKGVDVEEYVKDLRNEWDHRLLQN